MKNPKTAKTFHPGDVCFAKVRGFPPWPARVVALAEENTVKQFRYHVVFFGTGERGLVKAEEMFDYFSNKEKFNKTVKRKGFREGMTDIENYIASTGLQPDEDAAMDGEVSVSADKSTTEGVDVLDTTDNLDDTTASTVANKTLDSSVTKRPTDKVDDSDGSADDNLVIDETPKNGPSGPKAAATGTGKKRAAAKRKKTDAEHDRTDGDDQDVPAKRIKTVETPTASVMSRSGRKIKPKKFSDDLEESVDEPAPRSRKSVTPAASKPATAIVAPVEPVNVEEQSGPNYTEEDGNGKPIKDCADDEFPGRIIMVKTPDGQICKIKIDHLRPASFPDEKARLRWDDAVARNARKLKVQIQEGTITVDAYRANMVKIMEKHARKEEEKLERKSGKLKLVKWLKIETRLLEIDVLIKMYLSLSKADIDSCLLVLDELGAMVIDPLMLKKHPLVVETVKKLRRYIGNTESWTLSDDQLIDFKSKANQIRLKADHIYNKMKSLFIVPQDRSFWEVFSESVQAFSEKVKDLDLDVVYKIIDDPTATFCATQLPTKDKEEPAEVGVPQTEAVVPTASEEAAEPVTNGDESTVLLNNSDEIVEPVANGSAPTDKDEDEENRPPVV